MPLNPFYRAGISDFLRFSQTLHPTTSLLVHSRKPCSYFTEKIEISHSILTWSQPDKVPWHALFLCILPLLGLLFSTTLEIRTYQWFPFPLLDPSHQHLNILKPFPFTKKTLGKLFNSTESLRYHHRSSSAAKLFKKLSTLPFSSSHSLLTHYKESPCHHSIQLHLS